MLDTVKNAPVNGLDLAALGEVVEAIEKDASQAKVGFQVTTRWLGQTKSEAIVDGFDIGGNRVSRSHTIVADEPCELLGADSAPNPEEPAQDWVWEEWSQNFRQPTWRAMQGLM